MSWKPGDRLTHRFNPDLGPGLVAEIDGRSVVVIFPADGTTLRLSASSDALAPLEFRTGAKARLASTGEIVVLDEVPEEGPIPLADGREAERRDLWPLVEGQSPLDRLAVGEVDSLEELSLRLESLHLSGLREADGLGSFLGGRIRLFPHQLHVAEQATRADPVRWLLADEVGLGKTVEACLILNRLLRTARVDRALVVAPDTLTVQWLGELWRKYHQVFVLLDEKRLADVERDYGEGFNPFDAHDRVVVGLEFLVDRPWLVERAVDADLDMVIVDEAHRLHRPPGHPGYPAYRAVAPLCAAARHALLLTATPLEDDAHGFFRLLQLLRPDAFPEEDSFEERLRRGEPLPPCTSSTRRVDIGGLPPRRGAPVDLSAEAWAPVQAAEDAMRAPRAEHAVAARAQVRRIRRALSSGPSLGAVLDAKQADQRKAKTLARTAAAADPRVEHLARAAREWRDAGEKSLIFVAHRETLEWLRAELSRRSQLRTGVFHEDLSPGQRDIEVAQFRLASGPSLLISTECGGEGRNFEFCRRIVLFDLPWNPMTVEQRIGRLDRIGRTKDVEIVYYRPETGLGAAVARLYEGLGLFERPLGGMERELAGVSAAVEELALSGEPLADARPFRAFVEEADRAWDRMQEAAYAELHRDPYDASKASAILSRVPEDLEETTESVVLAACDRLHLHVEPHRDGLRHSIELSKRARVESLPGVPAGSSFLGTFDRAEAVADEAIDFFASGHPLVEGVLAWLHDSDVGRVGLVHRSGVGESGIGLLALYRRDPGYEAVAFDAEGRERPEWASLLTELPLRSKRVSAEEWTSSEGWARFVRALAPKVEARGMPDALVGFRLDS